MASMEEMSKIDAVKERRMGAGTWLLGSRGRLIWESKIQLGTMMQCQIREADGHMQRPRPRPLVTSPL